MENQRKMLERVEGQGLPQMNLQLMLQLEKILPNMEVFGQYFDNLRVSIEHLKEISVSLSAFSVKIKDIDKLTADVHATVEDMSKLKRFLTGHFEKMDKIGEKSLRAVDVIDSSLQKSFERLEDSLKKRLEELYRISDRLDEKIQDTFGAIIEEFGQKVKVHIQQLGEAYQAAIPNFKSLEQLQRLSPIESILSDIEMKMASFERKMENGNGQVLPVLNGLEELLDALHPLSDIRKTLLDISGNLSSQDLGCRLSPDNGEPPGEGNGPTEYYLTLKDWLLSRLFRRRKEESPDNDQGDEKPEG